MIDKIKGIIEEKTTHDVIISSGNFSFIIKMSINSLDSQKNLKGKHSNCLYQLVVLVQSWL